VAGQQDPELVIPMPQVILPYEKSSWYAIQTRARHEKKVAAQLRNKGVNTFLPLLTQVHRWSDRCKMVQLPLFPCYTFACLAPSAEARLIVLQTAGVVCLVGSAGNPLPIPDKQVEDIRTLLAQDVPCKLHPFLRTGQRVRIRGGCLDGIEGIIMAFKGRRSLVISVDAVQQSVAICIEGYHVEILSPPCPLRGNSNNSLSDLTRVIVAEPCSQRFS